MPGPIEELLRELDDHATAYEVPAGLIARAAQALRERRDPLSLERIGELAEECDLDSTCSAPHDFARAIEAEHGIQ